MKEKPWVYPTGITSNRVTRLVKTRLTLRQHVVLRVLDYVDLRMTSTSLRFTRLLREPQEDGELCTSTSSGYVLVNLSRLAVTAVGGMQP